MGADQFAVDLAGLSQPHPRRSSVNPKELHSVQGIVMAIDWVALAVFVFFFVLVTVMGFFAARWKAGPVPAHLDEWGAGWTAVRPLDHLVPGRRRFLYRLHRDRGAGAGLRGRRLWLLRAAVHHHRLSVRVRGDAIAVEGGASQRPCHRGRRGPRHLPIAGP